MPIKIKWLVQPKPTGRYKSFAKRGWPQAWYGEDLVAAIHADEDYRPAIAGGLLCPALRVVVYDYRRGAQLRKSAQLKNRACSVDDAKRLVASFYKAHPDWLPNQISPETVTAATSTSRAP